MVKHVVMWKLKDYANGNDKATNARIIKEKLEELEGKIEGVYKMQVGINKLNSPANYDVVLCADMKDMETLEVYQNHPEHLKVASFVRAANEGRTAVDFEV